MELKSKMAQANLLKREGLLLRAKGQELVLKSQKLLPSQPPTKPALREYFEELVNLTQVRQDGGSHDLFGDVRMVGVMACLVM